MTTIHKLQTELEFEPPSALTEMAVSHIHCEITFSYLPGAAPSFNNIDGGDPGWPDEIELVDVVPLNFDGAEPTKAQLRELADDWLANAGRSAAIAAAKSEHDQARAEARHSSREAGG
jgi:hypothetical protein